MTTTGPNAKDAASPTLLDEIAETMAHSMLVFLIADLRLLSATGRCHTKYQDIAIDSDAVARTTASQLAGLVAEPQIQDDNNKIAKGLTPAQIMAVLLLELRLAVNKRRERKDKGEEELEDSQYDTPFRENLKKGVGTEQMDSLLKAYAVMLGRDRVTDKDLQIRARRSTVSFLNSVKNPEHLLALREIEAEEKEERTAGLAQDVIDTVQTHLKNIDNPITQSTLKKANPLRQSIFKRQSERLREQEGEVVDAVFDSDSPNVGGSQQDDRVLSARMMVKIMEKAVGSREKGRLDFMQHFFKKDSVSQLMVRSRARVVWMNDWYPLKDLTYAIAVDEEKKRVLVVFRGAITSADWSHAADWHQVEVPNPIKEEYEGKPEKVGLSSGFLDYLFRKRLDTGTMKVDEIQNLAHKYGMEMIGEDYTLLVAGHSLGAALSTLFSFYTSTDERFTRNGPVKVFTFGSPYVGGHKFADCFRHQERAKKLQYARVYNHNDTVAHLPTNFGVTSRGSTFRHVGIGIKIPAIPRKWCNCSKWKPSIFYIEDEGFSKSYARGIGRNFLLHLPWAWKIAQMHTLEELQTRLIYGRMLEDTGGKFELLQKPIDDLYENLLGDKE